jgi:hypothetical protein
MAIKNNSEVTPLAIWLLINRGGPMAPTTIHGPLGITF